MSEKIRALLIYEILGRPKDYIKTTLEQLIDRIGENKGIKIIERKVHEPHLIDKDKAKNLKDLNTDDIFSTFSEVELEIDNLFIVFGLILNSLPSSIEIISPSELRLKNFDLNSVLSELAIKLHKYDEIAKALLLEKNQLINFIKETNKKIEELGGQPIVKFETEKNDKNNMINNENIIKKVEKEENKIKESGNNKIKKGK